MSNVPTLSASRLTDFSPCISNMTPLNFNSFDANKLKIPDSNINSDTLKDINKAIESDPNIDTIIGNNVQSIQCKLSELSEKANNQIKVLKFPQLKTIPEGAFENTRIEEAHLPNLNALPNNAFYECRQLRQVAIPMVTQIGDKAFYNCVSLGSLYANSVTTIGKNVFDNSGIMILKMNSLTSIGSQFGTCNKLSLVYLNGIWEIPDSTFRHCQALKLVEIKSASIIQPYAFSECPKLETVNCSGVIVIKPFAFANSGLQSINMASAISIGTHAFAECKNLQQIYWCNQSITSNYNNVTQTPNANYLFIGTDAFFGLDKGLIVSISKFADDNSVYYSEISEGFRNQLNKYEFNQLTDQLLIEPFSQAYRYKNDMYRNIKFGLDLDGPQGDSIETLTNAIQRCTNAATLTLYRGIKDKNTIFQMANKQFIGGDLSVYELASAISHLESQEIFDRSFISTSISRSVAMKYIDDSTNKSPGFLLTIDVSKNTQMHLMPIANTNDEVVLNRYQKITIDEIDISTDDTVIMLGCTATNDSENMQQIEESIYNSNEFKNYQREFELRLGQYAYTHQRSYNVVHKAIEQVKRLNNIDDSGDNIAQHSEYVQAFFSNSQYMGVHIPGNTMDSNDTYLQAEQLKLMLKSEMPNGTFDSPGNLREKMAALQSSSPNNMNIKTLETKEPKIDSIPRDEADQINFQRPANYQNRMGLNRSAREIYYQSIHHTNGMSPIISNETRLVPVAYYNNQVCQIRGFSGKRLIAGTSETTKHLLTYFKSLGFEDQQDLLNFRLAIIGYTLPENNASLYEVLQASHEVGVHGTENVSTAETMDQTIDPLTEEELREHVCRDGLFPFELCLREMFPEIFARRIQQEISKNDPEQESKKDKGKNNK